MSRLGWRSGVVTVALRRLLWRLVLKTIFYSLPREGDSGSQESVRLNDWLPACESSPLLDALISDANKKKDFIALHSQHLNLATVPATSSSSSSSSGSSVCLQWVNWDAILTSLISYEGSHDLPVGSRFFDLLYPPLNVNTVMLSTSDGNKTFRVKVS